MSCSCEGKGADLSFKVEGTYLLPYIGCEPLEPVDLSDATTGNETVTSLKLDMGGKQLIYQNEASESDVITVADIAALIPLSGLANVENAVPTDGDLLAYNGTVSKWQGRKPAPSTLVTAIGYDSTGALGFQDITALTQAPVDNTPRVLNQTTVSTLTFDTATYDNWNLTAQATNLTLASPGSAADHTKIIIRIKDDGSPHSITWNVIFRAMGVTLPTTTVAGKVLYIGARYDAQDNKWDVLGISREG